MVVVSNVQKSQWEGDYGSTATGLAFGVLQRVA